jgi:hypothetical protein
MCGASAKLQDVLQVKPNVPFAHIIMNVLIDHCSIERVGLSESEESGEPILNNTSLWSRLHKLLCNAPDGPVEMNRKGNNSNIFPWNGPTPEPLLSGVRFWHPHCV